MDIGHLKLCTETMIKSPPQYCGIGQKKKKKNEGVLLG